MRIRDIHNSWYSIELLSDTHFQISAAEVSDLCEDMH